MTLWSLVFRAGVPRAKECIVPLPTIALTASDYPRLERLARVAAQQGDMDAIFLLDEINRAIIVTDDDPQVKSIVTIGSWVTYWTNWEDPKRTAQLVWPEDRTSDLMQVSVLSGLGAALLGLRAGDQMPYFVAGCMRIVKIQSVNRYEPRVVPIFVSGPRISNRKPNDDPGPKAA
jgi:transcription elongation GreA/GreB family factor